MATPTPTMEIDKLTADAETLKIKTELLIFLSDGNLMASPIHPPETPPTTIRLSDLPNNLYRTFVFKDPKALEEYFNSPSHPKATHLRLVPMNRFIDAPFPRVIPGCPGWTCWSFNKPPEVCEFYKALPFPFPTREYVSIDNITYPQGQEFITLVADWRAVCRAVPKKHQVREITFDLDGSMKLHSTYVSRVVQMVSTVFAVKAEGPFRSRLRDDEPYPGKNLVARGLACKGY
ncbi:uncharacterized protein PGRI_001330 [Penicillium griseofulvum]|uniref:Uncharacterized protein n=1 Tax=Penicillium patulum TaxID=5078 RepID=A0A135LVT9_PENPA|nr:uncharacterized protein PGRI_001330 [Penicillium griseofulvum]KXG53083.1 hypothetical protein PGRI_001330 [Penicillium griseofulvum]